MREKYYWLAGAGWLVLVLCVREILLAGCSKDEANIVMAVCLSEVEPGKGRHHNCCLLESRSLAHRYAVRPSAALQPAIVPY